MVNTKGWIKGIVRLRRKANSLQATKFIPVVLSALSMPVLSYEGDDIILRVGYANVDFREDSNPVLVNGAINLGDLSVESQQDPLLSLATMFNEKWGIEVLIPFIPLELKAYGKGGIIDGLPMGTARQGVSGVRCGHRAFGAGVGTQKPRE